MANMLQRLKAALADRYRIERELGSGGMATVYLAQDLKHERHVAVKVLRPELAATLGPERFLREIKITANLNHPHILPLLDSGEADGFLFYVMPYVEGESLGDRLKREKQLPIDDALRIAGEVADALGFAHDHNVIHRDIKPENILLEAKHAVVADFGVARAIEQAGETRLTDTGIALGTPAYLSPEQASGGRELDGRSDVYALGCVLYEMLAGEPPFTGPTAESIAYKHLTAEPPPVTDGRPNVPDDVVAAVSKSLEKTPADRYQTAEQLGQALSAVQVGVSASMVKAKRSTPVWLNPVLGVLLLVIAAVVVVWARNTIGHTTPSENPMLAVLPFENLGPPENEYFAAGITDVITARLTGISGLGVISRSSAMHYEDSEKTPREIGQELGIGFILQGTVQRERPGDPTSRVRIVPRLVRVSDNTALWAEAYDAQMSEVFALQSDIAEQVARSLEVSILEPERRVLVDLPTRVPEASDLYLTAMGYSSSRPNENSVAVQLLERAIGLDSGFALAYAKLSGYHSMAFLTGFERSEERLALAKQAVDQALGLEPNLPEAHRALGLYYYRGYRDYQRALEAFSVAAQYLPNDAALLEDVAYIRRRQGAFALAAADFEKAVALNPRSSNAAWQLGVTLAMMRRYAEAAPHLEAAISLGPDDFEPYILAAWNYLAWDSTAERARATLEQMPAGIDPVGDAVVRWYEVNSREGRDGEILERLSQFPGGLFRQQFYLIPKPALYAMVYRRMQDLPRATAYFDSARTLLEQELEETPDDPRVHASLGLVYAGLGMKEEAVRAAERAVRLQPVSRDAMLGPSHLVTLAEVLASVGEHRSAIEQLEHLLSIPAGFWISAAMLRADHRWDPLRSDARFQALLERYQD